MSRAFKELSRDPSGSSQVQPQNDSLTHLVRGEWLSEAALWATAWHHTGDLRARSDCQMIAIMADDFERNLQGFQQVLVDTVVYARFFVQEMNANGDFTDLPAELEGWGLTNLRSPSSNLYKQLEGVQEAMESWGSESKRSSPTQPVAR